MINSGHNQIIFVKEETTAGTPNYPTSTDSIQIIEQANFKQDPTLLEDMQKRDTQSKLGVVVGAFTPGEFDFKCYLKPSGALGTEMEGGLLLENLFGKKTIVGSTSVTYSPSAMDDEMKTLTMAYRHGDRVYWGFGVIVNKGIFDVEAGTTDASIGGGAFSGQFMRKKVAGRTLVNDAAGYDPLDTDIIVDDSRVFETETLVELLKADGSWENNAGAGYEVTAINNTTNTITISPGLVSAIVDDAPIRGFLPVSTESGNLICTMYGTATQDIASEGATDLAIIKATIEFNNNNKILDNTKSSQYPTEFAKSGQREVTISIEEYVDRSTGFAKYFNHTQEASLYNITIPVGDVASKRYTFNIPTAIFANPEITGDEELTSTRTGTCYASSSFDDEITIVED